MVEITLQGPAKNALSSTMLSFLLERVLESKGAPLLLTGAGDAFSAGLDLKEVSALDGAGMERYLRLLELAMSTLYLHPAPVVAAINGHAIAGGGVIAACCDYRVSTDNAKTRIGLNEVALGVRYPPRVFHIVRERVPRASQEWVVLGAQLLTPDRALALGLVDELASDPSQVARERLATLAASPADGYAATKRALRGSVPADLAPDAALDRWFSESLGAWTSDALKAKILSILKR